MKSKKGVIITIIVLVTITVASFSVWQIPENPKMMIVVTNFESHLEGIDARHELITNAVDNSLLKMLNDEITPEELIAIAEISSSQINSQIIELVESDAPEEWQESYLNYLESLRSSNSYIREIIALSNLKIENSENNQIDTILMKIEKLQLDSAEYAKFSVNSRP
ncbi:MAG: hypothetical protein QF559_04235 [Candidatus Nitrosopelagicus sp.]|jgi:hypothetical protein|nr:hypothetical protein [Candidatus Nitrosopelagicus sp.]